MITPLKLSLSIVFFSLTFNLLFSIILYFSFNNKNNLKKIIEFIVTLPIFLPPSVIGYMLIIFLGKNTNNKYCFTKKNMYKKL